MQVTRAIGALVLFSAVSLFGSACEAPPVASPRALPSGSDWVLDPTPPSAERPYLGVTTLYLDFDGGEAITQTGTDDSSLNQSELGSSPSWPSFNSTVGAPSPTISRADAIKVVTDRVRTYFRPFNVDVVTGRPGSGAYTMVAVGGSHTSINPAQPTGTGGVSALDCTNSNPSNLVYVFSDDLPPMFGGLVWVGASIAHESGHSFGLEHTDNPLDLMNSVADPMQTIDDIFDLSFTTTGNFSGFNAGSTSSGSEACGRGNPLNNQNILFNNVGARPAGGDTTDPTMTLEVPGMSPNVPTQFPIKVTASDDTQLIRVEIYKDLELVNVLNAPPFSTTMTVMDEESFYLTVEAVDAAANRASITRALFASTTIPPLCANDSDCTGGRTCNNNFCRIPLGGTCTATTDCASGTTCLATNGVPSMICTHSCANNTGCPTGYVCSGSACTTPNPTMPKGEGESCSDGSECQSGVCQDTCLAACDDQNPCGDGLTCQAVSGGNGCVPGGGGDMPPPAASCAVAGHAAPPAPAPLVLLLGLSLALGRARLRRRAQGANG